MANELTIQKVNTIKDLLDQSKGELAKALPKHLTVDKLLRVALTTIRTNEALLMCNPLSLVGAIMQAAQLGLVPDGILGQAYLIPYKGQAQFQVGYKGLIALAMRSGEVKSISAHVVFEKDLFDFEYGINEKLKHIPSEKEERGGMRCVYAIAHFKGGGYAFDVMTKKEVAKTRASSKCPNSPAWKEWEEEMWRKTVVKRLAKYLPLSTDFQQAAATDDYIDAEVVSSMTTTAIEHKEPAKAKPKPAAKQPKKGKLKPGGDTLPKTGLEEVKAVIRSLEKKIKDIDKAFDFGSLDADIGDLDAYGAALSKKLGELKKQ
ncbi:MAG: recombinase RecT [Methylococcaceae bacterium]